MADGKSFTELFDSMMDGVETFFGTDGACKKCGAREVPSLLFSCACGQKIHFCLACRTPDKVTDIVTKHLGQCDKADEKIFGTLTP